MTAWWRSATRERASIGPTRALLSAPSTTRSKRLGRAFNSDASGSVRRSSALRSANDGRTAIAAASVTENSRSSRPTMPLMNSTGMNAATSDTLIERR